MPAIIESQKIRFSFDCEHCGKENNATKPVFASSTVSTSDAKRKLASEVQDLQSNIKYGLFPYPKACEYCERYQSWQAKYHQSKEFLFKEYLYGALLIGGIPTGSITIFVILAMQAGRVGWVGLAICAGVFGLVMLGSLLRGLWKRRSVLRDAKNAPKHNVPIIHAEPEQPLASVRKLTDQGQFPAKVEAEKFWNPDAPFSDNPYWDERWGPMPPDAKSYQEWMSGPP